MVNGLVLPTLMKRLLQLGKWVHPGDDVLHELMPWGSDAFDLLDMDGMKRESQFGLAKRGGVDLFFREASERLLTQRVPPLPWLNTDMAVMIACNREPGADVGICLDYRTDANDPRVVASHWPESLSSESYEDFGHFWREVTPTFSEFVKAVGIV